MGLKEKVRKVGQKIKKRYKERELRAAKRKGMTLSEYQAHKAKLRKKEAEERRKLEEWKIERKYQEKRTAIKEGKPESALLRKIGDISKNVRENLLAEETKKRKKKANPFAFKQPDYNKVVIELVHGKPTKKTKKRKRKKKKKKSRR